MKAILGKKIGMTHTFDEKGNMIPVTVVEAGPCIVTQIKTNEKEGYDAVQIGFGEAKRLKKTAEGHLKKIKNQKSKIKNLREIKSIGELNIGDTVSVDIFDKGDIVQVEGVSKGKGFAGVIKRHGFHRGPMSHGSHHHRSPGSIGSMFPQHVFKGTKLPGRMGHEKVTVKRLEVVNVDAEKNMIAIKGAVPGPKKGLVVIKGIENKSAVGISQPAVDE